MSRVRDVLREGMSGEVLERCVRLESILKDAANASPLQTSIVWICWSVKRRYSAASISWCKPSNQEKLGRLPALLTICVGTSFLGWTVFCCVLFVDESNSRGYFTLWVGLFIIDAFEK